MAAIAMLVLLLAGCKTGSSPAEPAGRVGSGLDTTQAPAPVPAPTPGGGR